MKIRPYSIRVIKRSTLYDGLIVCIAAYRTTILNVSSMSKIYTKRVYIETAKFYVNGAEEFTFSNDSYREEV